MFGCKKYKFGQRKFVRAKGGFKSEETGGYLPLQNKYSKSLSWTEKFEFPA